MNKEEDGKGDGATQTDQIVEYFASRPGKKIGPSDVAKELGLNINSTTTIINRLAADGILCKEGRGNYYYASPLQADVVGRIYAEMHKLIIEGIGRNVLEDISIISPDELNNDKAFDTFSSFVESLSPVFGEDILNNMIRMTVTSVFKESEQKAILEGLGGLLDKDLGSWA